MSGEIGRRVEERLRSEATGARRDPSPGLRARIAAAIHADAAPPATGERGSIGGPAGLYAWRGRLQDSLAAASVLLAIGLWAFAFLRLSPSDVRSPDAQDVTARESADLPWMDAFDGVQTSSTPAAIAQLALATPQTLSSAIDASLFTELENIAQDATRAARFVVGRVPASFVARATPSSPH